MLSQSESLVVKRIYHPFQCRLPPRTNYPINDPASLVGTGFFSIAMAIFTAFRMTPVYLLSLLSRIQLTEGNLEFFRSYGSILIFSWLALFFLSLTVGGIIMTCSRRIRKRSILLFQPWALLLFYFDGIFWLCFTINLHILLLLNEQPPCENMNDAPGVVHSFVIIYVDIALFIVIHVAFASYYITAELTVIENFF